MKALAEKSVAASLAYHQNAIQLDPEFALGYWALGGDYADLGEVERANGYFSKAFQLRERASERERLTITGISLSFSLPPKRNAAISMLSRAAPFESVLPM